MARLAAFGRDDGYRPAYAIKIGHAKRRDLAIPAAREERRLDERPEFVVGGIRQPLGFRRVEIAYLRCVHFVERLRPAPRLVRRNFALAECVVESGLEDGQHPIRCRTTAPCRVGITRVNRSCLLFAGDLAA